MNRPRALVSGLSGHELFCLNKLGLNPGQLALGNSVVALGAKSTLTAGLSTLGGGEVEEVTQLVHDGRKRAIERMVTEAKNSGGHGLTGVTFEMVNYGTNLEFVAQGSAVHDVATHGNEAAPFYATAANGQELYCQSDAGFAPRAFVFGNIAYSIGLGGTILGSLRRLGRGEVKEFTDIFDHTRHRALERIVQEAKNAGANAVLGIHTNICPLLGTQEMTMVGTAAHHPLLHAFDQAPVTSDLTAEEMWNVCHLGMVPLQLVMGVSVYSLGLTRGITSVFRSFVRGEVGPLTALLYEARDTCLARIEQDAKRLGADCVLGVKLRVYELGGGLVEVMALGTAVKAMPNMRTQSPELFPQALVPDRQTFIDTARGRSQNLGATRAASSRITQGGVSRLVYAVLIIVFVVLRAMLSRH